MRSRRDASRTRCHSRVEVRLGSQQRPLLLKLSETVKEGLVNLGHSHFFGSSLPLPLRRRRYPKVTVHAGFDTISARMAFVAFDLALEASKT